MSFKTSAMFAGAVLGLALALPASAAPVGAPLSQSLLAAQASDDGQVVQVQYRRGGGAVRGGGGGRGGAAFAGGGRRGGGQMMGGGRGGRGAVAGGRGWGRRGGGWGGAAAAVGALGVLGAIAADQAAAEPYYEPAPVYAPRAYGGGGVRYCMQRYRSYDPYSRTYVGYDGQRYPCP